MPLKKISSIFFLSLMLLLHYGKAITYLHCKIESFISAGSAYCDCEKQITDNADINQINNTAQKITFKEKGNDHIFTASNQFMRKELRQTDSMIFVFKNNSTTFSGFQSTVFQPPKA